MLPDACFLFELLLRLTENETLSSDLDYFDDDKKISRLLTDLILLENQIPFSLLPTFMAVLSEGAPQLQEPASFLALCRNTEGVYKKLSLERIAESPFGRNVARADFSTGVCHFLHLIHSCSPDPCKEEEPRRRNPLQLQRCARKLQVFGITIRASQTNDSQGNVACIPREFLEKFEFEIKFDEGELIIPTLHIKEETEVKWRNLIAGEQIGWWRGISYKFSSYAYFFKGLVPSVHDLKLLKDKGVINVHGVKDEDVVNIFQSITTDAKIMDGRCREICKGLNEAKVNGVAGCWVLVLRMAWHYWRLFLEWLRRRFISWILILIDAYLGTPWKFIGFVSGAALLVLTIMQHVASEIYKSV